MNETHKIKIFKGNADKIFKGKKTFEIVKNLEDFQEGDSVTFTVINHPEHPINLIGYEITHVMAGWDYNTIYDADIIRNSHVSHGVKSDYVALGLKRLE